MFLFDSLKTSENLWYSYFLGGSKGNIRKKWVKGFFLQKQETAKIRLLFLLQRNLKYAFDLIRMIRMPVKFVGLVFL